jgi:hypothetical protein
MRKNGRTGETKQVIAFRNFANTPEKLYFFQHTALYNYDTVQRIFIDTVGPLTARDLRLSQRWSRVIL